MLRNLASIAVGLCLSATGVLAQGTWTPQEGIENLPRGTNVNQHLSTFDWKFEPITDGTQVTGFFGSLQGTNAFGSNVKLMYFSLGSDGHWTSYGWAEDGTDGAIAWIKSAHGSSAFDRSFDLAAYTTTATAVAPVEMKNGYFITDPTGDLIGDLDKDQAEAMTEWLAEGGYPVAPGLSQKLPGGQIVLDELMGFFANQAEYTLYPLKTTYANLVTAAWPCHCVGTATTTTLPGPGAPTLTPTSPSLPYNPHVGGGGCTWHYRRPVKTVTTTTTGDYFSWFRCPSCAGSSSTTVYEYTEVIAPCGTTPAPTPEPTDPWHW
jgi:hypothetical protein